MNTKICTKCNNELNIDEFGIRRRNGKEYYNSICRNCHNRLNREYNKTEKARNHNNEYQRNRRIIKKKCGDCGCHIKIGKRFCENCLIIRQNNYIKPGYDRERYLCHRNDNHQTIREKERIKDKDHIDRLTDKYIKGLLTKHKTSLSFRDITPEMINVYRKLIIIKRILRRQKS